MKGEIKSVRIIKVAGECSRALWRVVGLYGVGFKHQSL